MPVGQNVYAKDFMAVLKKKHESGSYKSMVIYIEACEAGSMFKGLLPNNINIYVTTASNHEENSYGYYCPGDDAQAVAAASSPDDYGTCLGDLYSIAWLEDRWVHQIYIYIYISLFFINRGFHCIRDGVTPYACANSSLFYVAIDVQTESSDVHDMNKETLQQQYEVVSNIRCIYMS